MGRRTRRTKMESNLVLLICSSILMISSSALQQFFSTAGVANKIDRRYNARATVVSHGIGHGSAAGGGSGENGGGSRPHTGGGGTAVIPIYAAGSSQAHHRQGRPHNGGNRYENNMGLLIAAVLAAFPYLYSVFSY